MEKKKSYQEAAATKKEENLQKGTKNLQEQRPNQNFEAKGWKKGTMRKFKTSTIWHGYLETRKTSSIKKS